MRSFEQEANNITEEKGLGNELKEGADFLLNDSRVNKCYKQRMVKYYCKS